VPGLQAARPGAKKISLAAAEQAREDVAAARAEWAAAAPALRPEDLVFVDESGVATNMVRRYGRAEGGRRVRGVVPHGRWERVTILGGLSRGGLTACLAVESATDAPVEPPSPARPRRGSANAAGDFTRGTDGARPAPRQRSNLNSAACAVPSLSVTVSLRHVPAHARSVFHT
jgi:hypothetical protein